MYQLKMRDVLFPPEIFLHLRSEATQSVIGIHHNMNASVDQSSQDSWVGVREEAGKNTYMCRLITNCSY